MFEGIIEDTQVKFDEFIKIYANARVNEHPKATDENHKKALPKFRQIASDLNMEFETLYKDYQSDAFMDMAELRLNEEEKRFGMQGLADCNCEDSLMDDVDEKM